MIGDGLVDFAEAGVLTNVRKEIDVGVSINGVLIGTRRFYSFALSATAKGGSISKIVPTLSDPVTTARSEVDMIITEFGVAELKCQTLAERTRRIIAIAHPDFRDELDRAAYDIRRRGF